MPTIGQALSRLGEQQFVGRERELAIFRDWLTADTPQPAIMNVSGPGGVGKSTLLRAFHRSAIELGHSVVVLDGQQFRATPEGLLGALGGSALQEVVASLNATCPLLLLDTFEQFGDLTRYLLQQFLPALDAGVRIVIAGRYPLSQAWSREGVWHQLVQSLPLDAWSSTESRAYLGRRNIERPELVEHILRVAGGHPLALSLAADLAQQFGVRNFDAAPEWHLTVRTLVEQFLHDVDDPSLHDLLEACSVVRQLDEALVRAIAGEPTVTGAFGQLCRLSMVQPGPRGIMLHDDVRRILAEDLRWRRPDRYEELRRRALLHYRERLGAASGAEREWLLTERLFLWENAFVRAALFEQDEPGEIWIESGRREDHPDVMRIWSYYLTHILPTQMEMQIEFDVEADCQFLETLLLWPGLRLRIARDMHGRVVGFGIALPICRESLDLLADHPLVVLPCAYWDSTELATLPATAEAAEAYYLLHLAHTDWKPTAVSAALARDLVGLLALGGLFFVSTPFPKHKRLYEALGFDLVPSARTWAFGQAHPADGYVLDLRGIGVEAWLEAITSGQRSPQPRVPAESDRVLATVLFTDIVQSTERAAQLGDRRWRELLSAHNDLARRELDRFGGREVRTTGDGVLAIFDGPARGVQCASAMIEAVRSLGLSIRAGLHTGECELIGNDIGGIAVHIGARVAELAAPGEILVSSTVKDLIAGSGIQFEDRGIRTLRGVPGEWRLFRGVI